VPCGQTVRSGLVYTKTHLAPALVNAVAVLVGPSHDWGSDGQLGIFAFVLWPRVDAWLGC